MCEVALRPNIRFQSSQTLPTADMQAAITERVCVASRGQAARATAQPRGGSAAPAAPKVGVQLGDVGQCACRGGPR